MSTARCHGRDDMSSASGQLRAVAVRTHEILDGCGLPSDRNGAVAYEPLFSRSQSEWFAAAQGWLDDPLRGQGLMMSSLLIDGRVVWGDASLHTVPAAYRSMREQHPRRAAAAATRRPVGAGQEQVAARRIVPARRHVRPQAPRDNADRQPCALGWAERRRRLRVDAGEAEPPLPRWVRSATATPRPSAMSS